MNPIPVESVVYITGAGFSAPLGLPVMGNFLAKAQDQYFRDPKKFAHFGKVFKKINDLARVRLAYRADLHNIEEIFSMLEMQAVLANTPALTSGFSKFICDVIEEHTPQIQGYGGRYPANWPGLVFGHHGTVPLDVSYGNFVASLLRLTMTELDGSRDDANERFKLECDSDTTIRYAVVTLNYDRVLERYAEHLGSHTGVPLEFERDFGKDGSAWTGGCKLAKLHGCVSDGKVVPPTWSKGVASEVMKTWRLAYGLLSQATQVRIIGYSLADSDLYLRYLLKTASMRSGRLKRIDVVCLDGTGAVRERYRALIEHPNLRFKDMDVMSYLRPIGVRSSLNFSSATSCRWNRLEEAHEALMREPT